MAETLLDAFKEGYAGYFAIPQSRCPYLLTSNVADAWVLGRWWAAMDRRLIPTERQLVKSRGYTWHVLGERFRVEGALVTPLGSSS